VVRPNKSALLFQLDLPPDGWNMKTTDRVLPCVSQPPQNHLVMTGDQVGYLRNPGQPEGIGGPAGEGM
jgi:hypothetical protein